MQPNIPIELQSLASERFTQWCESIEQDSSLQSDWIAALLLVSDYAYEWTRKQPQWLNAIDDLLKKDFVSIERELLQIAETDLMNTSEFEVKRWLRHQHHYYSIACIAFQLTNHLTIREITKLQSILARQLIQVSYAWIKQQFVQQYGNPFSQNFVEQDLVIMLMGKLGGGELNFSSDIDLIFCYPENGETKIAENSSQRSIENQKYFTRLAQKLVALLHETTADGFVYRVDMRLRPYGESGALVLSFDAMADYYLEQGREWERFAMIKADYLCPNQTVIDAIQKVITPFSFRRYIDFSVLDSIRQLKQKITSDLHHRNLSSDIKLGEGGIRELEFIVQSLQLISGGRNPELQVKNWWQTLEILTNTQLIKANEAQVLRDAYEFLRRLENILQFRKNEQTQQLPHDEDEKILVAIAMGFTSWQQLLEDLDGHRKSTESFFMQLFQEPEQESDQDADFQELQDYLLGDKSNSHVFSESQDSDQELLQLATDFKRNEINHKFGQRGRKRLNQLLPLLVVNVRKSLDPIETFKRCLDLLQSIGRRTAYFELLAENPPLLTHLTKLVSNSKWLVEQLKLYPSLLDELLFPANFGKIFTKQELQNDLNQALLRIEPDHIEEQLLAIGRFKVASKFKVATGFLNQGFHILEVTRQLTDIAELCLQALLRIAWREISQKYGAPSGADVNKPSNFVILGYGKLGSHELGFGSDLDLVFLYQGDGNAMTNVHGNSKKSIEVSQFYTRLTQRLVHYLNTRTQHGIMYEVDTRLRPSGRSGLLVSEFDAFVDYQKHEAWTWEKQALTRARVVVGDNNLSEKYQTVRPNLLTSDKDIAADVIAMRQKMRKNLDRTSEQNWDIKQGSGGLVDIEFLVQYWVLTLANQAVELPNIYSNHYWLDWLQKNEFVDSSIAETLKNIYEQYQNMINNKRLDMESGLVEHQKVNDQIDFVVEVWRSTFSKFELESV